MANISITTKTTTRALLKRFSPIAYEGFRRLHFWADLGNGVILYSAKVPDSVWFEGDDNLSDEDRQVWFNITIDPTENGWHVVGLVRLRDGKDFLVKKEASWLIQAFAKGGAK